MISANVVTQICAVLWLIGIQSNVGESRSALNKEHPISCSSSSVTLTQLKETAFGAVSCADNEDREFWEAACKCALNDLRKPPCPKCRATRAADSVPGSTQINHTFGTEPKDHASSLGSVPGNSEKAQEAQRGELRMQMSTSHVSPAPTSPTVSNINFIRFGK